MTKHRMRQYTALLSEIAMLEDQIASAGHGDDCVVDYAKDYKTGHPRVITLRGRGSQDVPKWGARKAWCQGECAAIEDFIAGVDDSRMRQLLTRRYIEGRSVEETAELSGCSERQIIRRTNDFFSKNVS